MSHTIDASPRDLIINVCDKTSLIISPGSYDQDVIVDNAVTSIEAMLAEEEKGTIAVVFEKTWPVPLLRSDFDGENKFYRTATGEKIGVHQLFRCSEHQNLALLRLRQSYFDKGVELTKDEVCRAVEFGGCDYAAGVIDILTENRLTEVCGGLQLTEKDTKRTRLINSHNDEVKASGAGAPFDQEDDWVIPIAIERLSPHTKEQRRRTDENIFEFLGGKYYEELYAEMARREASKKNRK